jgi:hypothetical protein
MEIMGGWTKEAYQGCARLSHSRKWALWYIRPKCRNMAHVVCHVRIGILTAMTCVQAIQCRFLSYHITYFRVTTKKRRWIPATGGCWVHLQSSEPGPKKNDFIDPPRNDLKFSGPGLATWTDEDYIGRVARVGRKVHNLKLPMSTIKRCLIAYKREWRKSNPRHWVPGLVTSSILVKRKSVCEAHAVCLVHTQASSVVHKGIETHTFLEGFQTSTFLPNEHKFGGAKKCVTMEGRSRYIHNTYIYPSTHSSIHPSIHERMHLFTHTHTCVDSYKRAYTVACIHVCFWIG